MPADETGQTEAKTLEMRVAELEDKLAKLQITEDEWRAYRKVASRLAGSPSAAPLASPVQPCIAGAGTCMMLPCVVNNMGAGWVGMCIVGCGCIWFGPCFVSGLSAGAVPFSPAGSGFEGLGGEPARGE